MVHGQDLIDLMEHAQQKGYAIPAVNCTSNSIINACMEAAKVGVWGQMKRLHECMPRQVYAS